MKTNLQKYALLVGLGFGSMALASCDRTDTTDSIETTVETPNVRTGEMEETTADKQGVYEMTGEVDNDLREFSTWTTTRLERADQATEQEWKEIETEYKRREAELEAKSNTWDDKTKQEWRELKDSYKRTEDRVQERLRNNNG